VWADALFGLVTYGFSKSILLIAAASPSVHTGNVDWTAFWAGLCVFLGLLFRDIANSIDPEH
jgi:hypothetical protein